MKDAWKNIIDLEVREVFRQGAETGTLEFLYSTSPSKTKYYHFIRRSLTEGDREEKMTKTQLVAAYGK